jgi:CheY-like chemotaxis protein
LIARKPRRVALCCGFDLTRSRLRQCGRREVAHTLMSAEKHAVPISLPPVVIIDDDPDDHFLAQRILLRAGVPNPLVAFTAPESALLFFANICASSENLAPASIVFCDVKMPALNGFKVVRELRQLPRLARVPIWMLSSSDLERDKDRAKECGATGYLVKFPPPEQLRKIIEEANRAVDRGR